MSAAIAILVPLVGIVAACVALGVSRATFYRAQKPAAPPKARPRPARALPDAERADVLSMLNNVRFADKSPAQVYATLLDEKKFLCSIRTMYRIHRRRLAKTLVEPITCAGVIAVLARARA